MTIEEAYIQFLGLVERNLTNNRVNVNKPRFILLFNDIQERYVEWVLEKRNEDNIRYVQLLLVNELPLQLASNRPTFSTYTLPGNYFDFANLSVYADKNCCGKRKMLVFEAKSENREELLTDSFQKPSYEFEETFYYLSNNTVTIYKDDFDLVDVALTYYRYPVSVDIAGYTTLSGAASTNINPEFDDKVVNRILIAMAKDFAARNSDTVAYEMDKDRLFTEV